MTSKNPSLNGNVINENHNHDHNDDLVVNHHEMSGYEGSVIVDFDSKYHNDCEIIYDNISDYEDNIVMDNNDNNNNRNIHDTIASGDTHDVDGAVANVAVANGAVANGTTSIDSNNKYNNNNTSNSSTNGSGFHIRWYQIEKNVQVAGVNRNSIALQSHRRSSHMSIQQQRSSPNNLPSSTKEVVPMEEVDVNTTSATTTTKQILKSISGFANPGEMMALMGPSGSGKTSLLNVISGRSVYQKGYIYINGKSMTGNNKMKRIISQIAYVKQSDIFFQHLTVRDQFMYTALLRLSSRTSLQNKVNKVNEILQQLRLEKVANNTIQMCSGGEKKRINIGSEIITNPAVIMLDEPTSGLDSSSAVSLIQLLSMFAKQYCKTVITSIHQPSSSVFRTFDRLCILSNGYVVYFGTPLESISYLKRQQLACPDGYNVADHWMDVLVNETSVDYIAPNQTTDKDTKGRGSTKMSARQQLEQAWDDNVIAEQIDVEIENDLLNHNNKSIMNDSLHDTNRSSSKTNGTQRLDTYLATTTSKYNTSWSTQYYILTHRAFKNSRSAIFTFINLTKSVAIGIVAGLLWYQMGYTEQNVNDIRSYLFFTNTYWVFDSMFQALSAFPSERVVILKERSSGSYHLSAYFLAKTTADAPVRLILPFLYITVSFWMTGISKSFVTFLGVLGCILLSVLTGESIGLFVGAAVYDLQKAMTIMTVCVLFLMLLGGFFVQNIPSFIKWAIYISPFKYTFDSSLRIVFNHPMPCDDSGALAAYCQNNNDEVSVDDLMTFLKVTGSTSFNIGMLLVMFALLRYWAYVALRRKKESER